MIKIKDILEEKKVQKTKKHKLTYYNSLQMRERKKFTFSSAAQHQYSEPFSQHFSWNKNCCSIRVHGFHAENV